MRKRNGFGLILVLSVILFIGGCKKEKTIEIYFTTSSAIANRGDAATTVTVELSEPVATVTEITFESTGATPIRFGSYNNVFSHDDSEKCQVTVDNNAFIDTMGHVKLGVGTKKFNVKFTPQFDNFPHASADYQIKMTQATNGTIRAGSDVFSYHINQADAVNLFTSNIFLSGPEHYDTESDPSICDDVIGIRSGYFVLHNYTYVKNGSGNYDLSLNYAPLDNTGTSYLKSIDINIQNLARFSNGANHFDCGNSNISVSYTAPGACFFTDIPSSVGCGGFIDAYGDVTAFNSHTPSPVYGNYLVTTGNINLKALVNVDGVQDTLRINGSLNSPFLIY